MYLALGELGRIALRTVLVRVLPSTASGRVGARGSHALEVVVKVCRVVLRDEEAVEVVDAVEVGKIEWGEK
jgi:hypothetical protein